MAKKRTCTLVHSDASSPILIKNTWLLVQKVNKIHCGTLDNYYRFCD